MPFNTYLLSMYYMLSTPLLMGNKTSNKTKMLCSPHESSSMRSCCGKADGQLDTINKILKHIIKQGIHGTAENMELNNGLRSMWRGQDCCFKKGCQIRLTEKVRFEQRLEAEEGRSQVASGGRPSRKECSQCKAQKRGQAWYV